LNNEKEDCGDIDDVPQVMSRSEMIARFKQFKKTKDDSKHITIGLVSFNFFFVILLTFV